jgi:hypothetical protein
MLQGCHCESLLTLMVAVVPAIDLAVALTIGIAGAAHCMHRVGSAKGCGCFCLGCQAQHGCHA